MSASPWLPRDLLRAQAEAIPAELRERRQWVTWKGEPRPGEPKPTKVPYTAGTDTKAKSNDPDTWRTFDEALAAYGRGGCDGIGYVFADDDPFVGIDLDAQLDPETGALGEWARGVVERLDSYTEWSPSLTGVHIIVRGRLPAEGRKKGRVEMYQAGRFFTMTGRPLPATPATIEERQDRLLALHAEVFGAGHRPERPSDNGAHPPIEPVDLDDRALLDHMFRARNGGQIAALWTGDTGRHGGDDSGADLALCAHLAFWTGKDAARMDRLFRQSGLYRPKWDERHASDGRTYGQLTIQTALDGCTEVYTPPARGLQRARNPGNRITTQGTMTAGSDAAAPLADVPPFPLDVLPPTVRGYVEEAAAAVGVPADLVAVPLLAFAAATIGSSQRLELKPGFWQRAILYVAVVAPPGSAKSPAQDAARAPLDVLQREAIERYREELKGYERELAEWSGAPKETRGERPERPALEHYFTTDATLEALAGILDTSEGVVLYRDEIVGWVKSCDAYRGGKGGDRQQWLSLWFGAPLKVDRKTREPVYVQFPTVCVAGGVQPDLLSELADEAGRRDGFIERILWTYQDTPAASWSERSVSAARQAALLALFRKLRRSSDEPVKLSADARGAWVRFYDENAILTGGASGLAQGIYAKLPNQAARLALVLHCLTHAENPAAVPLDVDTMTGALELAEYFRAHALRVLPAFGSVNPGKARGLLARVERILRAADGEWVSGDELNRKLGGHVPTEDADATLAALEAAGVIEPRAVQTGGRPRSEWHVLEAAKRQYVESPAEDADLSPFRRIAALESIPSENGAPPDIRDPATGRRLLDPYTLADGEELPF